MEKLDEIKIATEATGRKEADALGIVRSPAPLSWLQISAGRFLDDEPAPVSWLFEDIIVQGIVGAIIAAGGVGKSFLLLQLAFSLATGRRFGPFKPARKFRVLYLGGEDPENELHRRVWSIAKQMEHTHLAEASENLGVFSTVGKIGPLIALDETRNPGVTDSYNWLCSSLENMPEIDVLMIDPMSRFFGLPENENLFMTAWIQALEKLCLRHDLTILFAHHEAKNAGKSADLRDSSGRGGSALRDGCRWSAALRHMREQDGEALGVDHREYVEFDVAKSNYAPMLGHSFYFRRGPSGVLTPTNPKQAKLRSMAHRLAELIGQSSLDLTRADLHKGSAGKEIFITLKEEFDGFQRVKDMPILIDLGLAEGFLWADQIRSGQTNQTRILIRSKGW